MTASGRVLTTHGNHFSCSLTAVLLARVHAYGGDEAVAELLRRAGSTRDVAYLSEIANWIAYDEAVALWEAGAQVTHHPDFARAVGDDAARRLNASPVAALLRSLGSPEQVYRQITLVSAKFAVVTTLDAVEVGPGFAHIRAAAAPGFPRSSAHCAWTRGLMTQPTVLFGLPPATVEHESCQALGAPHCDYIIRWNVGDGEAHQDLALSALQRQLEAMRERLHSMFATASDLIAADDVSDVLARITDRAAVEVRAPRYLLAVRTGEAGKLHCHHKGFDEREAAETAERILANHPAALPESWLVVPVRSRRCDYGRLLAMYDDGARFFPQERELFEVYAQYAASALDSATALAEAKQRYAQSSALLDLARALATAATTDDVALRLAEAVPLVVDCDRVAVYIWDPLARKLVRRAIDEGEGAYAERGEEASMYEPTPGGPLEQWLADPKPDPIFIDERSGHPTLRELVARIDAVASILVPLATADSLFGLLTVSVASGHDRLEPSPDLLDRLSGVAAQATSALQNGRLVDQITHQALHDQLTGLANRLQFSDAMRSAIHRARTQGDTLQLFYIDLDGFKPVNDEFGHETGDHLLVAVGERLTACTRESDIVARLGGDEFAVLIDAPGMEPDAEEIRERFERAIEEPFAVDGHSLRLGASIGRAVYPLDGEDAETLLRVADAAMFETKRTRRQSLAVAERR